MPKTGWQETSLWKTLAPRADPSAPAVRATLLLVLNDVEKILDKGGTAETDFTLHDADHAFRVAERMCDLMPSGLQAQLSTYELALLLLSAYLHDIGMVPEQRHVRSVFGHIAFFPSPDGLDPDERAGLQHWLDAQGHVPSFGPPTEERIARASELTTMYARYRHNAWSAAWMHAHLSSHRLDSYHGWLGDLVTLCDSHHRGRDDLLAETFEPRLAGASGDVVHLRYLAMLLRVADVLDFDPERTPEVIFRHRDVRPESRIFWWKDVGISMRLDGDRVTVSARPSSARVHRAIEATIEQVEAELKLCRDLDDARPLDTARPKRELPHRWTIHTTVVNDVRPAKDSYVYIDGAFRPNVKRVLALLSGTGLYEDPFAAVRELLQNAFDAVREDIAYVRLRQANPADPAWERKLGETKQVTLRLERHGHEWVLVCSDNGAGMSRRIIERHLLVGGATQRPEILDLERRAMAAGFSTGRTGQFGIGTLSYFMIASSMRLESRRSAEPSESDDGTGWVFESDGLDGFGELRKAAHVPPGTTVTLRLRKDFVRTRGIGRELPEYVRKTVMHSPCRFRCEAPGMTPWESAPGWADEDGLQAEAFTGVQRALDNEGANGWGKRVAREARATVRCWQFEGTLGSGVGVYRIAVPYFELDGGDALIWVGLTAVGREKRLRPNRHHWSALGLHRQISHAWRGMRVAGGGVFEHSPMGCVEVNWTSADAVTLAVSRNRLSRTRTGEGLLQRSWADIRSRLAARFLSRENLFAGVNAVALTLRAPCPLPAWAVTAEGLEGMAAWKPVTLPFIETRWDPNRRYRMLTGQALTTVLPIATLNLQPDWQFSASMAAPDRICQLPDARPTPVWTTEPSTLTLFHEKSWTAFPPNWPSVAGIVSDYEHHYWNGNNPWVRAATSHEPSMRDTIRRDWSPGGWRGVSSFEELAALTLGALSSEKNFEQAREEPEFEREVRARAQAAGMPLPVAVWHQMTGWLLVLSQEGLRIVKARKNVRVLMPRAPDDWQIVDA